MKRDTIDIVTAGAVFLFCCCFGFHGEDTLHSQDPAELEIHDLVVISRGDLELTWLCQTQKHRYSCYSLLPLSLSIYRSFLSFNSDIHSVNLDSMTTSIRHNL